MSEDSLSTPMYDTANNRKRYESVTLDNQAGTKEYLHSWS
jgi:hypothetical protein